ncbi:metallo-beta-lactamase domain-containing protein [Calycina marina]|uniref:Metallo-beta-lactamase domain-containing protein n=1 Tax=Calycina marina TaxID=1763456 RepID=A0A9P7Z5A6_9HELO|nr:metallo-beta-lactamase domain-containing protein [Calycina marina]
MATQLAPLQEIERLSSSVIRILGGNPGKFTLQGTNTYLIGTGPKRILIDTGEGRPSWLTSLQTVLRDENAIITSAILTHWHHDHVSGQADLLRVSPYTKIFKNTPSGPQLDIQDGQTFKVEGGTLRAVYSPGHTKDHMALVLEEEDAMFTGDNVLGHGTSVFEDLGTYISSLEKMRVLFKGRAYPGHGASIEDGPSKILEYIRHRKQREDQVVGLLKSSKETPGVGATAGGEEWTSMEIVKVVYKNVPEALHLPAENGVKQILRKLVDEGKLVEDVGRGTWSIDDRASL